MEIGRRLAAWVIVALLAAGVAAAQAQNPPPPIKDKTQSSTAPPQAQTQPPTANTQQPPLAPGKIESKVKTVTLYATVRDKHGKIISTLNKDDFSLDEDGKPQTIAFFARETDVPLTLGPLVDTSLSQRHVLGAERDASYAFLDDILRADKDKAFLIHFDYQVELLQDLTASREKLKKAIGLLDSPDQDDRRGGGGRGAGTQLYDAIFLASNELMKKQQGRKALIILSDGVDRGSKESLVEAIDSAQVADTAVYSILFAGEEDRDRGRGFGRGGGGIGFPGGGYPGGGGGGGGYPGGGGGYPGGGQRRNPQEEGENGKKTLERISTETGGRFFEVSKKLPIDMIYAQIEEELRNQYSIGYTPSPADSSGGYHKIHVTLKDKDLSVAAREGYYSTP